MNEAWKTGLWHQFGAAIDTLSDALNDCPDALWRHRLWNEPSEPPEYTEFWFLVYHTLFWVDLYLTGAREGFSPPARFRAYEKGPDGILPTTPYTREDLQAYLQECRQKCRAAIEGLTEESAQRLCRFDWIGANVSYFELQLYSMRHVQEHAAQLNLIVGQNPDVISHWVPRARTTD